MPVKYDRLPLDQRTRLVLVRDINPSLPTGRDWATLVAWPLLLAGCVGFWALVGHWLGWL